MRQRAEDRVADIGVRRAVDSSANALSIEAVVAGRAARVGARARVVGHENAAQHRIAVIIRAAKSHKKIRMEASELQLTTCCCRCTCDGLIHRCKFRSCTCHQSCKDLQSAISNQQSANKQSNRTAHFRLHKARHSVCQCSRTGTRRCRHRASRCRDRYTYRSKEPAIRNISEALVDSDRTELLEYTQPSEESQTADWQSLPLPAPQTSATPRQTPAEHFSFVVHLSANKP